jgi:hypothetical protein
MYISRQNTMLKKECVDNKETVCKELGKIELNVKNLAVFVQLCLLVTDT